MRLVWLKVLLMLWMGCRERGIVRPSWCLECRFPAVLTRVVENVLGRDFCQHCELCSLYVVSLNPTTRFPSSFSGYVGVRLANQKACIGRLNVGPAIPDWFGGLAHRLRESGRQ